MKVRLAQLVVSKDIQTNLNKVLHVLDSAKKNEWVLFPEGMISGYFPESSTFLSQLHQDSIQHALDIIQDIVTKKNTNCIIGSAMNIEKDWFNCSIFISPHGRFVYQKNNLSTLDRNHFTAGDSIQTYISDEVVFGMILCRELVFPEQWKILKKEGAKIIFHVNNAIKISDKVREHLLISRAFENQIWVCSVNNAADPQTMRSMIIDPFGNIAWQSTPRKEEVYATEIDLLLDSDIYVNQERTDLIKIVRG